jgi:hypothetical protein
VAGHRPGHLHFQGLPAPPSGLGRQARTQGVELLNWIAMRSALTGRVSELQRNYHILFSNTASALLMMENRSRSSCERRGSILLYCEGGALLRAGTLRQSNNITFLSRAFSLDDEVSQASTPLHGEF